MQSVFFNQLFVVCPHIGVLTFVVVVVRAKPVVEFIKNVIDCAKLIKVYIHEKSQKL